MCKAFNCLKIQPVKSKTPADWPYGFHKIIKDIRELSFPASVFHKELDLKLISDELKAVQRKDLEKDFVSQRANHPPRHDFNFYSFKDMKILDEDIDLKFFNELRRTGNF